MKKTLFAALALAFVASCSNEEVVEMAQKEAIAFDNAFVNNSTRSVNDPSLKNSNLTNFAVYGFVEKAVLFDNVKVYGSGTTTTNDASWAYEGTKHYWIPEAYYNFCAIAPKDNGNWTKTTCEVTENNNISTTLSFTNDGETDLLYAEASRVQGKVSDNQPVAFTFRHLLSKVKFSFENGYNVANATIKVTGIKITNAYETANVALTTDGQTWTGQDGTLSLDFGNVTEDVKDAETKEYAYNTTFESYNEKLLIPSASKEYIVEFTVELLISGTSIKKYEHTVAQNAAAKVTFAPEAGKSYDIKAVISPENINPEAVQEEIKFTVTEVKEWTPATGDTTVSIPETTPTTSGN